MNSRAAVVVLLCLLVPGSLMAQQASPTGKPTPAPDPVLVANTAAEPVPVALVPGTLATVKDADNPARQPFRVSGTGMFGDYTGLSVNLITVPSGKRAVIEHCSCINYLAATDNFVRFELAVDGAPAHQFVHTRVGTSYVPGVDIWSFSQPVRLYADPASVISAHGLRRSTGTGGIECYISGYFVDVVAQ